MFVSKDFLAVIGMIAASWLAKTGYVGPQYFGSGSRSPQKYGAGAGQHREMYQQDMAQRSYLDQDSVLDQRSDLTEQYGAPQSLEYKPEHKYKYPSVEERDDDLDERDDDDEVDDRGDDDDDDDVAQRGDDDDDDDVAQRGDDDDDDD